MGVHRSNKKRIQCESRYTGCDTIQGRVVLKWSNLIQWDYDSIFYGEVEFQMMQ